MHIEIWFEFASTYSYLTVSRTEALLKQQGVDFLWRPFLLGPSFRDKGWDTSPFILDPVKGTHMWRDMERRSQKHNLPFVQPDPWPKNPIKAARVMTAALQEPWCSDFARGVFAAQYANNEDIASEAVLGTVIEQCGADPDHWLARAQEEDVKSELRRLTSEAAEKGIFGAPSFIVGDELFWGDDRLEDAISWAQAASGCSA